MSVYDIAIATLFADPNVAQDATFAPRIGATVPLRVIMRAPDIFQKMGTSTIETPTTVLEVKVADCPSLAPGDQFIVGGNTYTVQGEPRRDEFHLMWLVDVYEA